MFGSVGRWDSLVVRGQREHYLGGQRPARVLDSFLLFLFLSFLSLLSFFSPHPTPSHDPFVVPSTHHARHHDRSLLDEVLAVASEGEYDQMSRLLARIEGPPNNVQQNLKAASAALAAVDGRLAQRADSVGRDVYEYLKGIDFQTYFESRVGASMSGEQSKEFFEYSTSSAKAAAGKLDEFLRLMPEDQLEAAQLANSNSM